MHVNKRFWLMGLAAVMGGFLRWILPDDSRPPKFTAKEDEEWMLAPLPDTAQRSEQAYQKLIERLPQPPPSESSPTVPVKPPKPVWALKGIVDKNGKLALIEIDGTVKRIKEGANITVDEKLLTIREDRVVIGNAEKTENVLLYRTNPSKAKIRHAPSRAARSRANRRRRQRDPNRHSIDED
ncbi:MAG: hypothetical protein ACU837_02940 [Gammaproteobacteria bacterium]